MVLVRGKQDPALSGVVLEMSRELRKGRMEELLENKSDHEKTAEAAEGEPVDLQARDIQVLRFIHEQGYLVYGHIKSAFWENSSYDAGACRHRLEKLISAGFLTKDDSVKKKPSVYCLTEKGNGELVKQGLANGVPLFRMNGYYRTNMDHDLKVTNLRIFFRKHGLDGWSSERVLRKRDFYLHVPDGLLAVGAERIAIELENSTKGRKRYEALFRNYKRSQEYSRVFVVANCEIMDWVIDLEYDPEKVWFVEYKDLFRHGPNALFKNKADSFVLAKLL